MGRQQDPLQDAALVQAVRQQVGGTVVLRADANRKWSLNQAVAFGHAVAAANLQVCMLSLNQSNTCKAAESATQPLSPESTVAFGLHHHVCTSLSKALCKICSMLVSELVAMLLLHIC